MAGRGANWVLVISLPAAFTGLEIRHRHDLGQITIPFSTQEAARGAAIGITVTVEPGEEHVIPGTLAHGEIEQVPGRGWLVGGDEDTRQFLGEVLRGED